MKRIIGTFTKQQWINDFAERIGEEKFDATDRVLRLELSELHELDDSDATTDRVGASIVSHSGPFEVEIVDAIKEFFGVESLDEITAEMQADALAKYEAEPPTEYHVPVTRTESSTHILTVRAKTPHEAVKSALEEAGDIDFSSSCDAEYSADQAFPVKTGSK